MSLAGYGYGTGTGSSSLDSLLGITGGGGGNLSSLLGGFGGGLSSLDSLAAIQQVQPPPLQDLSAGTSPTSSGGAVDQFGEAASSAGGDQSAIGQLASQLAYNQQGVAQQGQDGSDTGGPTGLTADTGGNQDPNDPGGGSGWGADKSLGVPDRALGGAVDATGGNQAPGQAQPQAWGTPDPRVASQAPPGYRPVSDAPTMPGGQPPSQQGGGPPQSASPGTAPDAGGGGARIPQTAPAQQGAGAVGNMGGAAGIPLPALIQALMRRYQGRPPPFGGQPGFGAGRYGYPGGFPQRFLGGRPQGRAPFSPQSSRAFVPKEPMGGSYAPRGLGGEHGPVPQGPNYMQRLYRGEYPPVESQMHQLNTPAGPVKVNPLAANDFQGFTRDLQRNGFPFEKPWGSYNRRRMRWSNNWSSHAWGTAFDMNDSSGGMSPRMQQWMQQNPGLFQRLMRQWNMSQPLPGRDPNHIEWTGPNPQYHPPDTQAAGGPAGGEGPPADAPVQDTGTPDTDPNLDTA
jgi:hypothetical protein